MLDRLEIGDPSALLQLARDVGYLAGALSGGGATVFDDQLRAIANRWTVYTVGPEAATLDGGG